MRSHYIGLMSGTSMDGVDGVLVAFPGSAPRPTTYVVRPPRGGETLGAARRLFLMSDEAPMRIRAHAHREFAPGLKHELLALNTPGQNELHRSALASNALARTYAGVVGDLVQQAQVAAEAVVAIGAHGQTVRHRPREFDATGYTLQLNNPALLAELTGIDVVGDFRSRDVAAGGQGAPLAPGFHRAVFGRAGDRVAVLNIGGISNLSVLGGDGAVLGFDCGPGNALMDHWCLTHTGAAFDRGGAWAASGTVDSRLLAALQTEPYFGLAPPKSTGRDLFNPAWLALHLRAHARAPQDVQATLTQLTAWACAQSVLRFASGAKRLIVCGGGALNAQLMRNLTAHLTPLPVQTSDVWGVPIDQVEAAAFAWLAKAFVHREPGNLIAVTGASGPRILGALYPAR